MAKAKTPEYTMTGEEYEILYANYLKRSPKALLELAELKKRDTVVDLCCGSNARATKAAFEMGAKRVFAVDQNPQLSKLPASMNFSEDYRGYVNTIGQVLSIAVDDIWNFMEENLPANQSTEPDVVICQQGINYWFDCNYIAKVCYMTKLGGKFVFNTFHNKPPTTPKVKEYNLNGFEYVEVFQLNGDMIEHTIHVESFRPHTTRFKWISPIEFDRILKIYFIDVTVHQDEGTDIYVCTK